MTKFPLGSQPSHFGAIKGKKRIVRVHSGDPIYRSYKVDGKGTLVKKGESLTFTKDVWLRSKGQSVVSISGG